MIAYSGSSSSTYELTTSTQNDPAQLVVYGEDETQIYEGTAIVKPDGSTDLVDLNYEVPPPAGTPVQVVIYGPTETIIREGETAAPREDGSFEVILVN